MSLIEKFRRWQLEQQGITKMAKRRRLLPRQRRNYGVIQPFGERKPHTIPSSTSVNDSSTQHERELIRRGQRAEQHLNEEPYSSLLELATKVVTHHYRPQFINEKLWISQERSQESRRSIELGGRIFAARSIEWETAGLSMGLYRLWVTEFEDGNVKVEGERAELLGQAPSKQLLNRAIGRAARKPKILYEYQQEDDPRLAF